MKTIKINKSYRNASVILYMIVPDNYTDYDINESAEEICENEQGGKCHGYNMNWEVETNIDVITKVIDDEIEYIDHKRSKLELERDNLMDYLHDIHISQLNKDPF